MKTMIALFAAALAVAVIPWIWGPQAQPIFVLGVTGVAFMAGMLWQRLGVMSLVAALLTGAYVLVKRMGWEVHTRGAEASGSLLFLIVAFSGFVAVCALTGWFVRKTANKRLAGRMDRPKP